MTTAHEMIRALRLLPTAPFELLYDPETENVIVTWPGLPPELSLMACEEDGEIWSLDIGHRAKVAERLSEKRFAEIEAAIAAVYADQAARRVEDERYEAIHEQLLEVSDAH